MWHPLWPRQLVLQPRGKAALSQPLVISKPWVQVSFPQKKKKLIWLSSNLRVYQLFIKIKFKVGFKPQYWSIPRRELPDFYNERRSPLIHTVCPAISKRWFDFSFFCFFKTYSLISTYYRGTKGFHCKICTHARNIIYQIHPLSPLLFCLPHLFLTLRELQVLEKLQHDIGWHSCHNLLCYLQIHCVHSASCSLLTFCPY